MRLTDLVETSAQVGIARGKKEKISLIARLLHQARGKEVALIAHYLSGKLPQGRLGIGWRMIEEATRDLKTGPPTLELEEIDRTFEEIRAESGPGSTERKIKLLRNIISRCREGEKAFLIRLILGEIRQGALAGLVLEAIALAASLKEEQVRQAFMFSGDVGEVAQAALKDGESGLSRFGPKLFHPVSPMLATPVEGKEEAIERFGEAAWEYKLDGARVQIHKSGDEVKIFTRHLQEVTESVPELVILARQFPAKEAIFDGEAIALDKEGRPLSFQITMRRFGRVREIDRMQKELPLTPFFFDLLYLEGTPLYTASYRERLARMNQLIPPGSRVPRIITGDTEKAGEFLRLSLQSGHEGLMAKDLDSPYAAGQRGFHWLKIKPAQTLDLAILAAEWGHGRRSGWLSNLHLGARNPEDGGFVMLGKTFKGLTDEMLQWQTQKLLGMEIARDDFRVFVRPELLVEVAFSGVQESPRYPGGLALRFARVRRYREDKPPGQADTIQRVREIFAAGRRGA